MKLKHLDPSSSIKLGSWFQNDSRNGFAPPDRLVITLKVNRCGWNAAQTNVCKSMPQRSMTSHVLFDVRHHFSTSVVDQFIHKWVNRQQFNGYNKLFKHSTQTCTMKIRKFILCNLYLFKNEINLLARCACVYESCSGRVHWINMPLCILFFSMAFWIKLFLIIFFIHSLHFLLFTMHRYCRYCRCCRYCIRCEYNDVILARVEFLLNTT